MRAKSHDQRKGQWLINKIRTEDYTNKKMDMEDEQIVSILFNIENYEFDKLMENYDV